MSSESFSISLGSQILFSEHVLNNTNNVRKKCDSPKKSPSKRNKKKRPPESVHGATDTLVCSGLNTYKNLKLELANRWEESLATIYTPLIDTVMQSMDECHGDGLRGVAVQFGSNPSDHLDLVLKLKNRLVAGGGALIAQLNLTSDLDSITSCVQSIIQNVFRAVLCAFANTDAASEAEKAIESGASKKWSLRDLCLWYGNAQFGSKMEKPKIILYIQGLEACSSDLLDCLMETLHVYSTPLNLFCVLSLSSATNDLHSLLSGRVSSLLRLQYVALPKPRYILEAVLLNTLLSHTFYFKIDSQLLKEIVFKFDNETESLMEVYKTVQLAMFHFFTQRDEFLLTSLCCEPMQMEKNLVDIIDSQLSSNCKTFVEALPSHQFLTGVSTKDAVDEKLDKQDFWQDVFMYLQDIHDLQTACVPILKFVQYIFSQIPEQPFGLSIVDLYINMLVDSNIDHKDEGETQSNLERSISLFCSLPRHQLHNALQDALIVLRDASVQFKASHIFQEVFQDFEELIESLANVKNLQAEMDKKQTAEAETKNAQQSTDKSGKVSRSQYQQSLRDKIAMNKKTDVFKALKTQTFSLLLRTIKDNLLDPSSICYNELLYFKPASIDHFMRLTCASLKNSLSTALMKPAQILGGETEWSDSGLDTSTSWQVIHSAGKTVDVREWINDFAEALQLDPKSEETEARFFRASGELELVGFIKLNPLNPAIITKLTNINYG